MLCVQCGANFSVQRGGPPPRRLSDRSDPLPPPLPLEPAPFYLRHGRQKQSKARGGRSVHSNGQPGTRWEGGRDEGVKGGEGKGCVFILFCSFLRAKQAEVGLRPRPFSLSGTRLFIYLSFSLAPAEATSRSTVPRVSHPTLTATRPSQTWPTRSPETW